MDILLNELSLKGQFESVQAFLENGIPPLIAVLNEIDKNEDLLFKKYEFYKSMVTPTINLHAIFTGAGSRQYDEIRKTKGLLASLLEDPYWENNPKHLSSDSYKHNDVEIRGSSLAESCERDRVIISFICNSFKSVKVDVAKNDKSVVVDNLFNAGHYNDLAVDRGYKTFFTLNDPALFIRTNEYNAGQTVFKEKETGYYWYLDSLHKNHFEVFDSNRKHLGEADLNGNIDRSKKVNGRNI